MIGTLVVTVPLLDTDPCKNNEKLIYGNDTRLITDANDFKSCRNTPLGVFFPKYETDPAKIHVYSTDCKALIWYPYHYTSKPGMRINPSDPFTVVLILMTEGSKMVLNLTVSVSSTGGSKIFLCVFDDVQYYYSNFADNDNWMDSISHATCRDHDVVNETVSITEQFPFNKTSYYTVGIAQTGKVDLIHYTYEVWTMQLNHSDYENMELNCSNSNGCKPDKPCTVAYRTPPKVPDDDYGYSRVDVKKPTWTNHSIGALSVGVIASLVIITTPIIVLFYICLHVCVFVNRNN